GREVDRTRRRIERRGRIGRLRRNRSGRTHQRGARSGGRAQVLCDRQSRVRGVSVVLPSGAAMTAALAFSIAPDAVQSEALRERVQVLESRPGVREVLLVTESGRRNADEQHAVIVLGGGGGGFAVTSRDGVPSVHGGLPLSQRQ